ncbi:MAG: peptide deformylase, partial [Candidatus Rokubacteria bacterium]|nr:peptide deformylase [Candidatus Rokubacteria bacterium]
MAILKVARLGHPILRRAARPVPPEEIRTATIQRLVDDMIETMREYDGAGLAAPQVHEPWQIAAIEVQANPRYPQAPEIPLMVLVNPEVESLTAELIEAWEGCLSVDNLRGKVRRPAAVAVRYLDRYGDAKEFEFEGFPAVVVQHETDHLIGKLFIDRMTDLATLTQMK